MRRVHAVAVGESAILCSGVVVYKEVVVTNGLDGYERYPVEQYEG